MLIKELIDINLKKLRDSKVDDFRNKLFIIIRKVLGYSKEYSIAHDNESIELDKCELIETYVNKIIEGVPVQYLVNEQEFYGQKFYVNENVLIPQPDTELLVEEALNIIKDGEKVLDLCTGSGAIGVTIACKTKAIVYASDVSKEALEVAKINSERLANGKVTLIESDLFEKIEGLFDVIVSNPPYIESDVIKTLSKEVQNEPILALDGGEDGLFFYKKIIKDSLKFLKKDGYLLLEIGYNQKEDVKSIFHKNGYTEVYSKKDYSDNDRIVVGKRG